MTSEFLPMKAFEEYTTLPKFEEYFRRNRVSASAEAANSVFKVDMGSIVPPVDGKQDGKLMASVAANKLEENVNDRGAIEISTLSITDAAQGNASTNTGCHGEISNPKPVSSLSSDIITQFGPSGQRTLQSESSQVGTGMVFDTVRSLRNNQPQTCPPALEPQTMPFPRYSSLTKQEHHTYMEWYIKSLGKEITKDRNTAQLQDTRAWLLKGLKVETYGRFLIVFLRLQNIVSQEQTELQAFLQKQASINPVAFNYIPEELHSKLKAELLLRVDHIKQSYKNPFVLVGVHNFPQVPARPKGPVMKHIKTLLTKASVPVLRHVSPEESMSLLGNFKILPDLVDQQVMLSEQGIVQALMKKHNAHVYMSLRTLLALVDNHPPHFVEEWQVPFSSYSKGKGGIIFSEPLDGTRINLRSVYRTCGRPALFQSCSSYVRREVEHVLSAPMKKTVARSSHSEKSSSCSKEQRLDGLRQGKESVDCRKNEQLSWPSIHRTCVTSGELPEPAAKNALFFDVWDLGGVKVLLQVSRNDSILCQDQGSAEHLSLVVPYAKIEMQINHGFEQFSVTELCQLWWKMFLCQPSLTYCCRVDPKTGNIHNSRFYSMSDLTAPGSPFNPILSNKGLYSLLQSLVGLPEGEYLLKHDVGSSIAGIYKEAGEITAPGEAILCLDEDTKTISEGSWPIDFNRVDWIPLDPWIPLEQNIWEMHAPCTFPVPPDTLNGNGPKRQGGKPRFSKKAKKKKQTELPHVFPDTPEITFF